MPLLKKFLNKICCFNYPYNNDSEPEIDLANRFDPYNINNSANSTIYRFPIQKELYELNRLFNEMPAILDDPNVSEVLRNISEGSNENDMILKNILDSAMKSSLNVSSIGSNMPPENQKLLKELENQPLNDQIVQNDSKTIYYYVLVELTNNEEAHLAIINNTKLEESKSGQNSSAPNPKNSQNIHIVDSSNSNNLSAPNSKNNQNLNITKSNYDQNIEISSNSNSIKIPNPDHCKILTMVNLDSNQNAHVIKPNDAIKMINIKLGIVNNNKMSIIDKNTLKIKEEIMNIENNDPIGDELL